MTSRTWKTPPPSPNLFVGRDVETAAVVKTLTQDAGLPIHIAVLGAPGIGKTSLAVTALHNPQVRAVYREQMCFVQCDSAIAPGALLSVIAAALGIAEPNIFKIRAKVHAALSEAPALLVLDNFESAWESTDVRADSEALLASLASIESLALMVTMRGTERPACVQWSRPFLPPLDPLGHDSAQQAFIAISDVSEDEPDLKALLAIVDRLPLAITLMANMTQQWQHERCSRVLAMWKSMHTLMLQRSNATRLSSLHISIQLSLSSPRLQSAPDARHLLSVLSLLPDGIDIDSVPSIAPSIPNSFQSISVLLQTALIYRVSPGRIRMLAPIRAFIQEHHPPTDDLLSEMHDHYASQARQMFELRDSASAQLVRAAAETDGANIETVLAYCLDRNVDLYQTVDSLTNLSMFLSMFRPHSQDSLHLAFAKAQANGSMALKARCLRAIGTCQAMQDHKMPSTAMLVSALTVASEAGNAVEEIRCLLALSCPSDDRGVDRRVCREYAQRAALLSQENGVVDLEAVSLRRLGQLSLDEGCMDESRRSLDEARRLLLSCHRRNFRQILYVDRTLSWLAAVRGDLDVAFAMMSEASEMGTVLQLDDLVTDLRVRMGYFKHLQADVPQAIRLMESALSLEKGHPMYSYSTVRWSIKAYLANGNRSRAVSLLEDLQTIMRFSAAAQGDIESYDGHPEVARLHYRLAYDHCEGRAFVAAELLFDIGDTYRAQDEPVLARDYYIRSAVCNRRLRECITLLWALGHMADTYYMEDDFATAHALTMAVLPRMKWSGLRRHVAVCHFRLAKIAAARGEMHEAAAEAAVAEEWYEKGYDKRGVGACQELLKSLGM